MAPTPEELQRAADLLAARSELMTDSTLAFHFAMEEMFKQTLEGIPPELWIALAQYTLGCAAAERGPEAVRTAIADVIRGAGKIYPEVFGAPF